MACYHYEVLKTGVHCIALYNTFSPKVTQYSLFDIFMFNSHLNVVDLITSCQHHKLIGFLTEKYTFLIEECLVISPTFMFNESLTIFYGSCRL